MDVPSRSLWRVTLVQVFRVVADVAKPWALSQLPWMSAQFRAEEVCILSQFQRL